MFGERTLFLLVVFCFFPQIDLATMYRLVSSQSAINVADTKIMYLQNWSSMRVALDTYMDPLCPVTPGCYRWFGWLLPPTRAEVDRVAVGTTAVFNL